MEWILEYLQSTPLETRRAEADSILDKYQDRVPVIFDRGSPDAPKVDRHKLLCARQCRLFSSHRRFVNVIF